MGGSLRAFARTVPLILAALGLGGAAEAADPAAVEIVWHAPASCPSQREVEAEVLSTIGRRATRKEPIRAQLDVWESEGGGWKADLELSSAGQVTKRQVFGDTCKAVASAVAIVIGVAAIDDRAGPPDATTVAIDPAPAPVVPLVPLLGVTPAPVVVPVPAPHALPPSPPKSSPTPEAASSKGFRRPPFAVGASAVIDVGSLPTVTPGVELYVGVKPGGWRIEITGAYLARESGALSSTPSFKANLSQVDVGARACGAWGSGRFEAGPCLTARVAWVFAAGEGESPTQTGTGNLLTGAVGGRASLRLASWANVHLAVDVLAPIDRPNFYVVGEGDVFRPSAVTFRGFLGVDVQL